MSGTIFVIDDDEAVRDSLVFLFRRQGLPCRSFSSANAFLTQLRGDHRGCVVTDLRMPGMDGLALVEALRQAGSPMPVILVTGHSDVPVAVQAMKAGVADFIEKPFDVDIILAAVTQALEAAASRAAQDSWRAVVDGRLATLSERENQVLRLIVDGLPNKVIARNLDISPRTVEIHRANVMTKMQAESLSALVRMAIAAGLV